MDEERYPAVYENPEIKEWSRQNLVMQGLLRSHGLEFHRYYIGSAACSPGRTTLFTGHYPSLHGVTQTDGVAKGAFDSDMFWLDRNTVPTMGDYFRAAGYQTYYKGKWHISDEDIIIPGTHKALPSYHPLTGVYPTEDGKTYMIELTAWTTSAFPGGSVRSLMGKILEIPLPLTLLV
ncbi:MAG: sulfatase-like hydrolase/transferase [Bacillota bacterium]